MAIFVQINAMARQNDMGREGESEARAYLVKHGYNVLHTNWHWHHYELDIIAVKEDELTGRCGRHQEDSEDCRRSGCLCPLF